MRQPDKTANAAYMPLDEFKTRARRIINEPQEPTNGDDSWWWANEYLIAFARRALEVVESLEVLRSVWDAHMETCPQHAALPDLPAPSWDDLEAWRDAPSGTASA